jgi:hypothetical protein
VHDPLRESDSQGRAEGAAEIVARHVIERYSQSSATTNRFNSLALTNPIVFFFGSDRSTHAISSMEVKLLDRVREAIRTRHYSGGRKKPICPGYGASSSSMGSVTRAISGRSKSRRLCRTSPRAV